MEDINKLENIIKLMKQYRVKSVKLGDITVDGLELPQPLELPTAEDKKQKDEDTDDILFYSAGV